MSELLNSADGGFAMEELFKGIEELEFQELSRASRKFGKRHASAHEAAAVILEEIEEAEDAMRALREAYGRLWEAVKCNDTHDIEIVDIIMNAEQAAAELVQVGAMGHKASKGYKMEKRTRAGETETE